MTGKFLDCLGNWFQLACLDCKLKAEKYLGEAFRHSGADKRSLEIVWWQIHVGKLLAGNLADQGSNLSPCVGLWSADPVTLVLV